MAYRRIQPPTKLQTLVRSTASRGLLATGLWMIACLLVICTNLCSPDLFVWAAAPDGEDWPQFRGPNGAGRATAASLPTQFDLDENLLWSVDVPPGVSSPVVSQGRVFLTGFEKDAARLVTLCFDQATGAILWRNVAPTEEIEKVHEVSSPANATPVTDGDHVYSYFGSFGILAYTMSGEPFWQYPVRTPKTRFGTGTSPVLVDGKVILNYEVVHPGGAGETHMVAIDKDSGKEVWNIIHAHPHRFTPYSTPIQWTEDGEQRIALVSSPLVAVYDARDGGELWSEGGVPAQTVASPVLGGEYLIFSATGALGDHGTLVELPEFDLVLGDHDEDGDGKLAIKEIPEDMLMVDRKMSRGAGDTAVREFIGFADKNKDSLIDPTEWNNFREKFRKFAEQGKQGVTALRISDDPKPDQARVAWTQSKGVPEIPSPLYVEGRLYLVVNGGIVYCRHAESGDLIYRGRLKASGGYYASPVYGDNKVYVASDRGVVSVLNATGSEQKLSILSSSNLESPIIATPAIAGNTIYLRTEDKLLAFQKPE